MSIDSEIDRDDGLEAILKRFAADPEDTKVALKEPEAERHEEHDEPEVEREDPEEHEEAEGEHEEEAEAEVEERLADDEHLVQIGDAKVKVAELKRLHGIEAELTAKTTAAETERTRAAQEGEKAATILGALINKAQQDYAPYAKIDWVDARSKLDDAAYNQLKTDFQAVHQHLSFLTQEQNAFLTQVQQNRMAQVSERLKACDTALASDPETKGWDEKARGELTDYAIKHGLPPDVAKSLADPKIVKMVRKAMLYDKGTQSVAAKVNPVARAPVKTMKPGADGETTKPGTKKSAYDKASRTGELDDVAEALFSRFSGRNQD